MRLALFDRIRRLAHPRRSRTGPAAVGHAGSAGAPSGVQGRHRRGRPGDGTSWHPEPAGPPWSSGPAAGSRPPELTHTGPPGPEPPFPPGPSPGPGGAADAPPSRAHRPRRADASGPAAIRAGGAQVRIRDAPAGAAAVAAVPDPRAAAPERAAAGPRARLPFARPHPKGRPSADDGRRNCGSLERVLWRQWDEAVPPPADVVVAIDRLAELPDPLKERLARGLDAIFVGPGGVPELDEMTGLRGVPLPSGQASWDACAGAYGERKIVVGSQPSPTPDVMCHEVGHALDDLDSPPGRWQSDSAEFRVLYDQCQPHLVSDFHRQPGGLGRKEFFADAFAAIASRQRPALVDMLGGDTRTALRVMLYFNRRYGI